MVPSSTAIAAAERERVWQRENVCGCGCVREPECANQLLTGPHRHCRSGWARSAAGPLCLPACLSFSVCARRR
eukprot:scaffold198499_cov36-Tisochrysis_lutea.AAC.1